MLLFIDTSSNQKTIVKLGEAILEKDSSVWRSQVVLPMILELMKRGKYHWKDIKEIEVNIGPGSFTGLRVGVAIASALGYALKIPVNGRNVSSLEQISLLYN